MLKRINYVVGSPATVAAQLNEYVAATQVDRLGIKIHLPGLANEHVRQTMKLFAQEVAPKVELSKQAEAA
ncbi:hypothetical protein [Nostoc sp.]|uniref:hypothetical protein n=1 Tax=Nostoc sp. TaxID=1180 RepID=UPI002FFC7F1C